MSDSVLIGLSGAAGSGKDTAANIMVGTFMGAGRNVKTLSFAGKLKEVICSVFGIDSVMFEDRTLKNARMLALGGKTPREVAQFVGTECFRSIRSEVWVDCAMRQAQGYLSQGISVIFTDVRFMNEADAITSYGGTIVSLERNAVEVYNHASERDIPLIRNKLSNHVISNNGSMDELAVMVVKATREILS